MNVNVSREGNEATLKIEVPAAEVKSCFNDAVQKIANQVKIDGFRKGKAPRRIIEARFGAIAVKDEAFNMCINRSYSKAVQEEKLVAVSDPAVTDEQAAFESFKEGEDYAFEIKVTLKPEVELGDYRELHVEKNVHEVTDEEVDKVLEDMRARGAKMVEAADDDVIEKGDFAIIDFAGSIDGEAFDGGEGKGYPLEVGSGSFIPGFEEQLIGLKKGDDADVEVSFPEEYFVEALAGKEAVFKVHVQAVKHKELPDLNDELVAKNTEYKTIDEAKTAFRKMMEEEAERNAKIEYDNALIEKAVENAKVEIPAVMIEDRINQMVEEIRLSLEARKMTMDKYLEYTGMDMEKLREAQREGAEKNVRTDLVLDAIANKEELQLTDEDVQKEIENLAAQNGAKPEEVAKIIRENNNFGLLLANIIRRKAAFVILGSAK